MVVSLYLVLKEIKGLLNKQAFSLVMDYTIVHGNIYTRYLIMSTYA